MARQTNVTKAELLQFLRALTQYPVEEETIFFKELGLAGLDAETFMLAFSEQYHVDLSPFDSSSYYTDENDLFNPFKPLYLWLIQSKPLRNKTFTAGHLLRVIQQGVWLDP